MKVYRIYTDDRMFYARVGENATDRFWDMVTNNGWIAEEIANERL